MDKELAKKYFDLRAKYPWMTAASALRSVRAVDFWSTVEWSDMGSGCTESNRQFETPDGFTVICTIEIDEDPDISLLGKFTDRESAHTVINPESWNGDRVNGRVYRYFEPAITYQDHFKGLRDFHYSKGEADRLAREYVRRDMDAAREPEMYCLSCRVFLEDVELGYDSLSGIDGEVWDHAGDIVSEALNNAREALAG